jgi:thiol-disulfide isomerase/thioredoxin
MVRSWALVALAVCVWSVTGVSDERYDRLVLQAASGADAELVDLPARDFTLVNLDGEPVSLSSFRGRVVFLNFWATWCPPCREEFPSMIELASALADRPFVMLAVSQDEDRAVLDADVQELGLDRSSVVVLHDPTGETARMWGSLLLPETYLIDPDGTVAFRFQNSRDWSQPGFRQIIERMAVRRWRIDGRW